MISGNFQSLVSTLVIYQRCFALKSLLAGVNSVHLRIKMSFFPCQMYSFSVFHLINAFTQAKKYTPFIRATIKSPGIKYFQKYFSPPRAGPTLQGGIFVFSRTVAMVLVLRNIQILFDISGFGLVYNFVYWCICSVHRLIPPSSPTNSDNVFICCFKLKNCWSHNWVRSLPFWGDWQIRKIKWTNHTTLSYMPGSEQSFTRFYPATWRGKAASRLRFG